MTRDLVPPTAPRSGEDPASSGTIAWWATVLLMIAAGTMLVGFVFARVYLVGTGQRVPQLLLPLVATVLLFLGAVAAGWAHRVVRLGPKRQGAAAGLAVASALGAAHVLVLASTYPGLDLRISTSVDDATFVVLSGTHFGFLLVAVGASVVAALNLVGSGPQTRPRTSAQVAAAVWQAVLLAWLLVFVMLYLMPRLS